MISLRDLAADRWLGILGAIRRDEDPGIGNLVAALRREEPRVPGEGQLYLARLLSGDIDRRGAPSSSEQHKHSMAWGLVNRVERWDFVFRFRYKKQNPRQMAFDRVSKERGYSDRTAERYYRAATRLLPPWEREFCGLAPWKIVRRAAAYEADQIVAREGDTKRREP